ncbi:BEM46 family protein [Tremella mesenterica]|uniref:BEM46 family protein n=1 Tax=Tremella mesenterica TaxID=5217 RepID=A0A4V1M4U7_TREME|nr:BEM46 family protein [Tremella mesenterica]
MSSSLLITTVKYILGTAGVGATLLAGGLWYFQRTLIYPSYVPKGSRLYVPKPTEVGLPYEDVTLTTSDHVKIKAFVIPARRHPVQLSELKGLAAKEREKIGADEVEKWTEEMGKEDALEYAKSRPTIVLFHANAVGNMGHRVPLARKFNAELGCNVFMLSYRGYGQSEGHASERVGIRIDVETALEYITKHPILDDTKLILYGQSIGGAVCIWAAAHHPDLVSGVIIENTFLSLQSLIPLIMPQIPRFLLPVLLTERWDSHLYLPRIPSTTPMLFLSGRRDSLVPQAQMLALKSIRESNNGRTRWKELDGEHNDTCLAAGYWEEIAEWLIEVQHVSLDQREKSDRDLRESEGMEEITRAPTL